MQARLIVPIGLPCSGKSTYMKHMSIPMINPDSFRLAIHGQVYNQKAEPLVWTHAYIALEAMFLAGHTCVGFDATNLTKQKRLALKSKLYKRSFYVFETPIEECILRSAGRKDGNDWKGVIEGLAKAQQPLTPDELDDGDTVMYFKYDPKLKQLLIT